MADPSGKPPGRPRAVGATSAPAGGADVLMPAVYEELRRIARQYLRRRHVGLTLRPTELVHEAFLHLYEHGRGQWRSPEHFRAVATRKVWQVVVDQLRRRYARKRGGKPAAERGDGNRTWRRVPLEAVTIEWGDRVVDLLDLSDALEALRAESERLHDVVMLHWFGGLPHADVAACLGVSASTAEKDFRYALAWLNRRLTREEAGGAGGGATPGGAGARREYHARESHGD